MKPHQQWIKSHIINTCNQKDSPHWKPVWANLSREDLIERQVQLWARTPEVTKEMIVAEVDRLMETGQILFNGQRMVVGTPIFEERVPVTHAAEVAAKKIFENLLDRRGIKHELQSLDQDVKDELLNTIAKIIDDEIAEEGVIQVNPR